MAAYDNNVHGFYTLLYMTYIRSFLYNDALYSEWSVVLQGGLQKHNCEEVADVWLIKAIHFIRKPTFKLII